MYEAFYGLNEKPFSLVPDPHYLYLSRRHQAALNMLELAMRGQAGFSTITGEVGSGKTTIARRFLEMASDSTTVGLITNTHEDLGELLEWILYAFSLDYEDKNKIELYETFVDFLFEQFAKGQHTILLIDEAQNLRVADLEQLRVFSNIYDDQEHVLQIILIGQPELLEKLNRPELKQLAQRISVNFHLGALDINETAAYIYHRLAIAGANRDIFDEAACAAIYYFTGGIPRLINILGDFSLMYGYAEERFAIDHKIVWQVVCDKKETGLSIFTNTEEIGYRDKHFDEILKLSTEINIAKSAGDLSNQAADQLERTASFSGTKAAAEDMPTGRGAVEPGEIQAASQSSSLGRDRAQEPTAAQALKQSTQSDQDDGLGAPIELDEPEEERIKQPFKRMTVVAGILIFVLSGVAAAWIIGDFSRTQRPVNEPGANVAIAPSDQSIVVTRNLTSPSEKSEERLGSNSPPDMSDRRTSDSKRKRLSQSQAVTDETLRATSKSESQEITTPNVISDGRHVALRPSSTSRDRLDLTPVLKLSRFIESMDQSLALHKAGKILLSLWGHDEAIATSENPCQQAAEAGLSCFTESGSLKRLAAYDRPAIIMLRSASGRLLPTVISAFDGKTATLRAPGLTAVFRVEDIVPLLSGDYFVFWKPPVSYTRNLQEGMSGQDIVWLRRRLASVEKGATAAIESNKFDPALTERVMNFQKSHGLKPDGIVGPRTLMRLNTLSNAHNGPRLSPYDMKTLRHSKPES